VWSHGDLRLMIRGALSISTPLFDSDMLGDEPRGMARGIRADKRTFRTWR